MPSALLCDGATQPLQRVNTDTAPLHAHNHRPGAFLSCAMKQPEGHAFYTAGIRTPEHAAHTVESPIGYPERAPVALEARQTACAYTARPHSSNEATITSRIRL